MQWMSNNFLFKTRVLGGGFFFNEDLKSEIMHFSLNFIYSNFN